MRNKLLLILAGGMLAAMAVGVIAARDEKPPPAKPKREAAEAAAKDDKGLEAARDAIRKSAKDFEKAFEKGDAKAAAALWTEDGEYYDDSGIELHGRAAIEKAYAELFKERPNGKVEI